MPKLGILYSVEFPRAKRNKQMQKAKKYPFTHGILKRHLILPMPVDWILCHPSMATGDVRVCGAIWMLLAMHWQSGCKPLPTEETELSILARCNTGTWYRIRGPVLTAVADLIPQMTDMFNKSKEIAEWRHRQAQAAGLASAMARRDKKAQQMAPKPNDVAQYLNPTTKTPQQLPHKLQRTKRGNVPESPTQPRGKLSGTGLLGDKRSPT